MVALRKERGVVKGRMTRLENKVETELKSGQEISVEKIEVYIAKLEDIRKDFDDVQRKIYSAHVADPPVADVSEDKDFEDRYLNLKVRLKEILNRAMTRQDDAQGFRGFPRDDALARVLQQQNEIMLRFGNNGDSGSQASTPSNDAITQLVAQQTELLRRFADGGATARAESSVKLPVVNLPTFDGRTEEWKRFAETFQSLIHNNATIPGIQKFQYLISSISGPAAKIIESIELTNENYDVAWELLKKRFDDPRAIKKKHIQCLFAMPRVEKESSSAIRVLVDFTLKHLRILKSMGLPTDTWHDLIIHMIEAKLDIMTLRAWEQSGDSTDATLDKLTDFLQNRCQILERIETRHKTKDVVSKGDFDKPQARSRGKGKPTQSDKPVTLATSSKPRKCYFCQDDHLLYNCDKFIAMSPSARFKEVQRLKLCINCLRDDHFVKSCRMGSCKQCSERHNTLLHFTEQDDRTIVKIADSSSNNKPSRNVSVHHTSSSPKQQHVIMATAIVNASQANGSSVPLRILLDSASEANFITQASCNKLGVKRCRAAEIVSGLNEMQSKISQSCNVTIKSRHSNYQANVRCFVVPTITKNLPSVKINLDAVQIPANVKLADIEFHKPNGIDMLVGAELFFDLLEAQKIELGEKLPILQNTKLGWVVAGLIALDHTTSSTCNSTILTLNCSIDHCETLNKNLERFWEIENVPSETKQALSVEEQECEKFFDETTFRDDSGRFVVRLPFREDTSQLGNSREIAVRRLAQLERRFMRNKILQERYTDFMREYQELGHMSLVKESLKSNEHPVVYLPHHGVIKESSSTTKLRTVFDASSKTDSGVALNDVLHVGPTVQSSLIEIVIRFRCHNIAITGDLRKMYRLIIVHPDDRDYQRILWRESPEKPIQEFQLNTVTYGEASSAYLAIKCVRRLAEQAKHDYPIVSRVILDEMYVDDIMSGADDLQGAIAVQQQLTALLKTGGFEIHKWCSNCPESLAHVPEDRKEEISTHSIDTKGTIKTLGLEWRPHDDNFQFSVQQVEAANTKRQILPAISKFFDPLGLIGPILTSAKLLMQQTWKIDCSWDETLPTTFIEKWEKFRQDLNAVKTMLIPRRVIAFDKPCRLFLQGFCDASKGAYGACLYIQAQNEHGALISRLLCSKSRVAPIKTMSIPRLELCSALLLARLIASAQKGLRICVDGLQAWSDSTVALCWIRGDASRWKSFVANRVIEINEVVPAKHWNHMKGEENPADLISRGASPRILKNSELWWNGPSWLNKESSGSQRDKEHAPSNEIIEIIESEARSTSSTCNVISEEHQIIQEMLDRFSSLTRIERVLAYCLRFISNLKKSSTARVQGRLSVSELQDSHRRIVKHTQASPFAEEISTLKSNGNLKSSSKII